MKRASIRVQEPTPELIEKIRRARVAISQQKPRYLKCPYCQHNAIAVYAVCDMGNPNGIDLFGNWRWFFSPYICEAPSFINME